MYYKCYVIRRHVKMMFVVLLRVKILSCVSHSHKCRICTRSIYRVSQKKRSSAFKFNFLKRILRSETNVYSRLKVYSFRFLWIRNLSE